MAHAKGFLAWLSPALFLWLIALPSATSIRLDDDAFDVATSLHDQKPPVSVSGLVSEVSGEKLHARRDGGSILNQETVPKAKGSDDATNLVPMLVMMAFLFVAMSICTILMFKCIQPSGNEGDEEEDLMWPDKLYVTSTKYYDGTYSIVPDRAPNGMPLWKQHGQPNWIFAGEGNQWFIGDEDEESQQFLCNTGNVASFEEHAGRMPDEIGPGGWLFFNGEWVDAPQINITSDVFTLKDQEATMLNMRGREVAATKIQSRYRGMAGRRQSREALQSQSVTTSSAFPPTLVVSGAKSYSGRYDIVRDVIINGFPIWKRQGTRDWIFCGENGQWLIGDEDERMRGFICNTGNIASAEENDGRLPNAFEPGAWLFFDGMDWISDANIRID